MDSADAKRQRLRDKLSNGNHQPATGARSGLIPSERLRGTQGDGLLHRAQKRRLAELRRSAPELDIDSIDITAEDSLKKLLKVAWGYFLWAHEQSGKLDEDQIWMYDPRTREKVPATEFEFEIRWMGAVRTLAESIVRLQIDRDAANLEAQKIELISGALRAAAEAAGLDDVQKRALGRELRTRLELVESTG